MEEEEEEEQEFLESDIIFPENLVNEEGFLFPAGDLKSCIDSRCMKKPKTRTTKKRKKKKKNSSNPIDIIPENTDNISRDSWIQCVESSSDFFEEDIDQFVPPHVILSRRINFDAKMAFSVCTGKGRTLKGRDLSQVRNSILRMTGFLET
ncbi:hypothetical protein Vadar_030545 [Vaccinium darrowii]|uniref:Uncharacterized protein n=1 Tax=Vaccinium darrowii TaxID=229202 RepID=A0ACB7XDG9_9ERIC|nr:hypothetical protein Vadar_030545 [Vaccinium darrowii]